MPLVPELALQFAVVREDPRVERDVIAEFSPRRALLVASGGCTALAFAVEFDSIDFTLVDPNPAQIAHVRSKMSAVLDPRVPLAQFGVENDDASALHECGNFERLFRSLRNFLDVFVVSAEDRSARLRNDDDWEDVFEAPYWRVAFDLAFSDGMLSTMFGDAAVQHAVAGSYPGYFRRQIEAALRRGDRGHNPFLSHLLLGKYLGDERDWPDYLRAHRGAKPFAGAASVPRVIDGTLLEVPDFGAFDFVQLSNVLDWMDDESCARLIERLGNELATNAVVIWRQLNDPRDLRALFGRRFVFDRARDARLLASDRSMFYDRIHVGVRDADAAIRRP